MRELGRALALDPDNDEAHGTLMSIMATPPPTLPSEVVVSLAAAEETRIRRAALVSVGGYAAIFLYLPFFAWLGVKNGFGLVPLYFLALVSAGAAAYVWRVRASEVGVLGVMFASTLMLASTATLFGPLLVTPMLIAVNTGAYMLILQGAYRLITVVTGIGMLLAVTALGLFGVLPGGYLFDNGAIHVLEGAVYFPETPTIVFLVIVSVATIVTPAVLAGQIRDALGDLERQLYLYAWHVSELVPSGRGVQTSRKSVT